MEENIDDNIEQCSSSAAKRPKRSTSSVWDEFEKLPRGADGKIRAKCIFCGLQYVVGESGTSNLLRHREKCPNREPHDFHRSIQVDQEMYRAKMAMTIIKHNYTFTFVEELETYILF